MNNYYEEKNNHQMIKALTGFLADTAIVYFKTHTFHWNVGGSHFYSLHLMFEGFYKKIWESMDDIAERIRSLGEKTPSNYADLLKNGKIKEAAGVPSSSTMVKILRDDYLSLAKKAHEIAKLSEAEGDLVTTDLMIEKAAFLEKAAWMLQSSSKDD